MANKNTPTNKPRYHKPIVTKNARELFIIEAIAGSVERMLLHALIDDPNDETSRAAYADLLEEQGRRESALMVRAGEIPGVQVIEVGVITSGAIASAGSFVSDAITSVGNIVSGAVTSGAILSGYGHLPTVGPGAY